MKGILELTQAGSELNPAIVKAHPKLASMIKIQRPRSQETIIEMLNSRLMNEDGATMKRPLDEKDPRCQKMLRQAAEDLMNNNTHTKDVEFLNAFRRNIVDIGMWARPGWLSFFDFISLADDEHPQIQQDFENEFPIIQLGQEMGIEVRRYLKENMSFRDINMEFRSTPELRYTIRNPDTGSFNLNRPKMNELERAHTYNMNELGGDAIALALGAFPTALGGQSFFLHNAGLTHSSFKNVPSSNDLDLSAQTKITKEIFIAIFDYMVRMPGFGEGQDFRNIRTILVPSIDMKEMWRFVAVTSGFDAGATVVPEATFAQDVIADLQRNGIPTQMFGIPFSIVPDKTLPTGSLYVSFDQAAGTIWEKPGHTMVVDRVEMENNVGVVKLLKNYQVAIEPHQRPNVIRVTYK